MVIICIFTREMTEWKCSHKINKIQYSNKPRTVASASNRCSLRQVSIPTILAFGVWRSSQVPVTTKIVDESKPKNQCPILQTTASAGLCNINQRLFVLGPFEQSWLKHTLWLLLKINAHTINHDESLYKDRIILFFFKIKIK